MNGYASVHPKTAKALKALGIRDEQIMQGWGDAEASAGYHLPVGTYQGVKFSHCFDLSIDCATPDMLQRLLDAAILPFVRDWPGNRHVHNVHLGLTADDGKAHLRSGPRGQALDMLYHPRPLNGLANHALLVGYVADVLRRTPRLREELRGEYEQWLPDVPTQVVSPTGQQIQCYAWNEGSAVVAEVRMFAEWWDCDVSGDSEHLQVVYQGQPLSLSTAYFDGRHWRANVREMAEALNLGVGYVDHGLYATVQLSYPGQAAPVVPPSTPALVHMVDVSHHNGDVDFYALREAGILGAWAKASEGMSWFDPRWDRNREKAAAAGVMLSAYHYFLNDGNAGAQSRHFREVVGDFTGLLPPALDVEDPEPMGKEALTASVLAWLHYVEAGEGVVPMVYSYPWYNTSRLLHTLGKWDLWAASYPSKGLEGKPVAFAGWPEGPRYWQWTDHGTVPGVPGQGTVDRDVFFGTEQELRGRLIKAGG